MTRLDWAVVVLLAAAVVAVTGWARLALWVAIRGITNAALALLAAALERPARQLPPGHAWHVALYVEHRGMMRALASGTVTGPWKTAGEVEAEAMRRWVAKYDWPKAGRLCARAEPVAARQAGSCT